MRLNLGGNKNELMLSKGAVFGAGVEARTLPIQTSFVRQINGRPTT
jgi:hypothetical protein